MEKYVEPFAGLGRTAKILQSPLDPHTYGTMILNDMSKYAISYLKQNFPHAIITKEDFTSCIVRHDSPDTFFLIDPPYRTDTYQQNKRSYADRTDREYYQNVIDLLPTLKGDWLVCADATRTGKIFQTTPYTKTHLYSKRRVIFGKKAHIQIISKK